MATSAVCQYWHSCHVKPKSNEDCVPISGMRPALPCYNYFIVCTWLDVAKWCVWHQTNWLRASLGSNCKRTEELWRSRRTSTETCLILKALVAMICWGKAYTSSSVGWYQLVSWHTRRFALAWTLTGEMSEWDCLFSKGNCESSNPPTKKRIIFWNWASLWILSSLVAFAKTSLGVPKPVTIDSFFNS